MIFPFIRYKTQKEPCLAQGPSIQDAHPWHGNFEGTEFSLSLPYSNKNEPYSNPKPGRHFDHRSGTARYFDVSRWSTQAIQNRRYRFWGPRGIGEVNSMEVSVWHGRIRKPEAGSSLFNPRVFEFEVIDYIEDRYIRVPKEDYRLRYPGVIRAPIDWKVIEHLPGPAACFHVDTATISAPNYFFATTLDNFDLLFIGIVLFPDRTGPKHIPPEEWVDLRNMKKLMYDIYASVRVTLSPQAESNRDEAIQGLSDISLTKNMQTHNLQMNPYYEQERAEAKAFHEKVMQEIKQST